MVIVLATVFSACYVTDREIIVASDAVAVDGLAGKFHDKGTELTVTAVPYSNDFRFQSVDKKGNSSTGYLRAVPLRDRIYLVQAKYDDQPEYYLVFYEFIRSSQRVEFERLDANASDEELVNLAQQHGVKLIFDEFSFEFGIEIDSGTREGIVSFLKSHRFFEFVPVL